MTQYSKIKDTAGAMEVPSTAVSQGRYGHVAEEFCYQFESLDSEGDRG